MAPVVCFPFAGDIAVGGGHVSALLLIRNLNPDRFQPVLAIHGEGPVQRWLAENVDLPTLQLNGRVRAARGTRINDAAFIGLRSWSLAGLLRKHQVAIVHVNDTVMLGTWALATRLAGAKLLWHKRGPSSDRRLHGAWFRLTDHMIAISKFAAPPVASAHCSVILNPFELPSQDRAARRVEVLQETGLPPETGLLGFFADLDKGRKRPEVFLEMVALAAKQFPSPVAGLLFGHCSDDTARRLHCHAEDLGVAHLVRFMGFRYPPHRWMAACDLLIAPGVAEGFGRTLVEAMLLGTVVVAADSGGHREIIKDGETGALVRPDDAGAFAERACALLGQPNEAARLAGQARAAAAHRFGADRHVAAVTGVYEAMLNREEPRPAAHDAA